MNERNPETCNCAALRAQGICNACAAALRFERKELRTQLTAALMSETGTRELTPRECFETYRNLVWTVQEADGMNRGWVEFARRLNEIVQFRPTQAGSDTPAPAK